MARYCRSSILACVAKFPQPAKRLLDLSFVEAVQVAIALATEESAFGAKTCSKIRLLTK